MKARILEILRTQGGSVSSEALRAVLGISAVAIGEHIQSLTEAGYAIRSTSDGYRLLHSPDIPFAWEFAARESRIFYYPEIASTMDVAKNLARRGCPDFTVVIAGRQQKGRGRLNRVWLSAPGGLYFTVVLRPALPILLSPRVGFAASLTLVRVLRKMFAIPAVLKWPNDILVDGRKVAGMLSEMEADADRVSFINIGLGINVNNDPAASEPTAASLKQILGRQIASVELLARFLDDFEARMQSAALDDVIDEWKRYTVTLKRHVRIVTHRAESEGLAVDIDANGALVLQLADGSRKKIIYGDCFHMGQR
ncbi:MAG: biotin--[acetyl-CoA-carboxylase] ligase [Desulfobacterales bacterium]|nr:MAG: biotin--[acetyl-CoA-carboxylase] ligase [Desulfobacterales bacterium]